MKTLPEQIKWNKLNNMLPDKISIFPILGYDDGPDK